MKTNRYTARDIANYFLFKAQIDEELITNLKLQKLVYYAQGLHLVIKDVPLFDDDIEAWIYGPVVPELYHSYKAHGAKGIPADEFFDPDSIDKETEFLDEIYTVFGQFSAMRLKDLTHNDQCWKDASPDASPAGVITHKAMKETLKKYIKDEEE